MQVGCHCLATSQFPFAATQKCGRRADTTPLRRSLLTPKKEAAGKYARNSTPQGPGILENTHLLCSPNMKYHATDVEIRIIMHFVPKSPSFPKPSETRWLLG